LARTTKKYKYIKLVDNLLISTSLESHRISLKNIFNEIKSIYRFSNNRLFLTIKFLDWENLAKAMFDDTYKKGGIFHLWGHSWVIEKQNEWKKLEQVLIYISNHKNVSYLTNKELLNNTL